MLLCSKKKTTTAKQQQQQQKKVSSANIIRISTFEELGTLFTYKKNNSGPSIAWTLRLSTLVILFHCISRFSNFYMLFPAN